MNLVTRLLLALAIIVVVATLRMTGVIGPRQPRPGDANPNQADNDRFVEHVTQSIVGHETEPAGNVFENIQLEWLKTVPADRFLRIMNAGYSRALGVSCSHCHDTKNFASDDKRPKRAAREMATMHRTINNTLSAMQNLANEPADRLINCSTCHRGAVTPAR